MWLQLSDQQGEQHLLLYVHVNWMVGVHAGQTFLFTVCSCMDVQYIRTLMSRMRANTGPTLVNSLFIFSR